MRQIVKHLNFENLVAWTLWTCIAFVIINAISALNVFNSLNVQQIIGH